MDSYFSVSDEENSTIRGTLPMQNTSEIISQNVSNKDGCIPVLFSEMEYLPWENPNDIISAQGEEILRRIKDFILFFMFLIGGPGNIINMAVFYKQGLKNRVNLCLFALALADEMNLITAMCHSAEQVHLQFTTKERFGPMLTFLYNNHLSGFFGSTYVSVVLSAIIACERCLCVVNPLKFQTLIRTRTMAVVIIAVFVIMIGLYFIVAFRFHIGCMYDPTSGVVIKTTIARDFYKKHQNLVDGIDSFAFGAGVPGVMMTVVIIATIITVVKLRQIVTWRAETSSSSLSPREIALTKMLVGTSILFIACVTPFAGVRFCWLYFPQEDYHNFFLSSLWINEILTSFNTSLNIVVYYVMGSRYRETFWDLFSRKSKLTKTEENVSYPKLGRAKEDTL